MSTKIVNDLLRELGPRRIQTIGPNSSTKTAAALMGDLNVGSLVVVDDGKVIGIVTERDMVNKIAALDKLASTVPVREIMTQYVEAVSLQTNLKECEDKMRELHVRHLPVLDKGTLVGVISIRDLLVSTRAEQEQLVKFIRDYSGL